ncbi:MAG: type II toxin-antitoxin system VapC family toxin [Rhizomicrobium sp.]
MARYLLDSHAFLWAKTDPGQIGPQALAEITDRTNRVYVSAAGLWELAIKSAAGKLAGLPRIAGQSSDALMEALRESGFDLLSIELPHVLIAARLPLYHRDPFDRVMIAQAQQENLVVVTRDGMFARYGVRVIQI